MPSKVNKTEKEKQSEEAGVQKILAPGGKNQALGL
jgi:hypothetical protein